MPTHLDPNNRIAVSNRKNYVIKVLCCVLLLGLVIALPLMAFLFWQVIRSRYQHDICQLDISKSNTGLPKDICIFNGHNRHTFWGRQDLKTYAIDNGAIDKVVEHNFINESPIVTDQQALTNLKAAIHQVRQTKSKYLDVLLMCMPFKFVIKPEGSLSTGQSMGRVPPINLETPEGVAIPIEIIDKILDSPELLVSSIEHEMIHARMRYLHMLSGSFSTLPYRLDIRGGKAQFEAAFNRGIAALKKMQQLMDKEKTTPNLLVSSERKMLAEFKELFMNVPQSLLTLTLPHYPYDLKVCHKSNSADFSSPDFGQFRLMAIKYLHGMSRYHLTILPDEPAAFILNKLWRYLNNIKSNYPEYTWLSEKDANIATLLPQAVYEKYFVNIINEQDNWLQEKGICSEYKRLG